MHDFLFSALRHVPSNVHWCVIIVLFCYRRLKLRDVFYAEEYLGATCSFFCGADLEAGSFVAAKIYI